MSFGPKLRFLKKIENVTQIARTFDSVEPSGVNKNLGQQKPRIV
jgi:hypothetical protein